MEMFIHLVLPYPLTEKRMSEHELSILCRTDVDVGAIENGIAPRYDRQYY